MRQGVRQEREANLFGPCRQKQKDKHEELERSAADLAARLKRTLGELDALQNQKKVLEIALTRNSNPAPSSSASITQVCFFLSVITLQRA